MNQDIKQHLDVFFFWNHFCDRIMNTSIQLQYVQHRNYHTKTILSLVCEN
jgi:hypothetical protein